MQVMWSSSLLAVFLFVTSSQALAGSRSRPVAIPVRLAFTDGVCRYWNTDVGLNASQLRDHLGRRSDKSLRVELWTRGPLPESCIVDGVTAAFRAGFATIYIIPKPQWPAGGDPPL